jgi:UDP-N-acetylmuramoylalanine-D-glutamate ligase
MNRSNNFISDEIWEKLEKLQTSIVVTSLMEAIDFASSDSEEGDIVLFSPAAEYFSYFRDKMPGYKNFRHIVESLD